MKKIKYKREKYFVSRSDKSKIRRIKFVLFLKRWKRRVFQFVPNNGGLYIALLIVWVVFGIVFYFIRRFYMAPEIYMWQETVGELIIPFFTSFVLVIAICGYTQAINYHNIIREQYNLYIDVLHSFDKLFAPYLRDELTQYMPLFNAKCFKVTLKYLQQFNLMDRDVDKSEFAVILEDILEQLEEIKNKMMDNAIVGMHRDKLKRGIKDAKKTIKHLLLINEENKFAYSDVENLAYELFAIIDDIRRPWRWDIENNCKILGILAKYDENNIEEEFYNRMHLYGHTFSE